MSVMVDSNPSRWAWDMSPTAGCLKTWGKLLVNIYTNKASDNRFLDLKEVRIRKDRKIEWLRNDNSWPNATALAWKQSTLALYEHKSQSILSYGTLKYREQTTSQGECDAICGLLFDPSLSGIQQNLTKERKEHNAMCRRNQKHGKGSKGKQV